MGPHQSVRKTHVSSLHQNFTSVMVDKAQKGPAKGITGLTEYVASFFGQLISFSAVGFQKYRQNTTF